MANGGSGGGGGPVAAAKRKKERTIPVGSVWKYSRTHHPSGAETNFLDFPVDVMFEVTDLFGIHFDLYLFYNDHHGGFWPPSANAIKFCSSELSRLARKPDEFWKLVDKGIITRVGSLKRS